MDDQDKKIVLLSLILQISARVRQAKKPVEIGFLAVNETKQLINYRQSALWLNENGVFSVSGLPFPDTSSPYIQWLTAVFRALGDMSECRRIGPSDLPRHLVDTWQDWLPLFAVIAPLFVSGKKSYGFLLLANDTGWEDHEIALLNELCSIYSHGFKALAPRKSFVSGLKDHLRKPGRKVALIILIISVLFIPVRLSVQAPAEVSPKDPFVIRSPLDGIIDRFRVRPNEEVKEGQVLFEFDRASLKTRMEVAAKTYQVAAEEYRQTAQMAVQDEKARPSVESRRGKMKEREAELSLSRHLFDRIEVKSPRPGIAIFADPNDWVGKNVYVGERILIIADPANVEMLIYLPVADALELQPGTDVKMYLTADPQKPRYGKLNYASYKPEVTPAGFVAYRLKADFIPDGTPLPRVGFTGVVKLYSKRVTLAYLIFRRPLTALRQRLGW